MACSGVVMVVRRSWADGSDYPGRRWSALDAPHDTHAAAYSRAQHLFHVLWSHATRGRQQSAEGPAEYTSTQGAATICAFSLQLTIASNNKLNFCNEDASLLGNGRLAAATV